VREINRRGRVADAGNGEPGPPSSDLLWRGTRKKVVIPPPLIGEKEEKKIVRQQIRQKNVEYTNRPTTTFLC
jgi:hypothetical protein